MKLFICGYARHGKDTAAEMIKEFTGMSFQSSSLFCCKLFIYEILKDKYFYESVEECYNNRIIHRFEWHDLIRNYNKGDETRLSRHIFQKHDIYVGIRAIEEVIASREAGIVDLMLWIDASNRIKVESLLSITIIREDADIIITNNGSLEELKTKIKRFCSLIVKKNL